MHRPPSQRAALIELIDTADFLQRVQALHRALGIPHDYQARCGLPLCPEPDTLVDTEPDYYNRVQRLTPAAFSAWRGMKRAAAGDGVELVLISAYRGLDYQHDLIARKLARGQTIEQILTVNAAPGYSEHHTGRAIDIGTPGIAVLSEEFENTEAFQWLDRHAGRYGFRLSFPRDNPWGIAFEPWHWCYTAPDVQA